MKFGSYYFPRFVIDHGFITGIEDASVRLREEAVEKFEVKGDVKLRLETTYATKKEIDLGYKFQGYRLVEEWDDLKRELRLHSIGDEVSLEIRFDKEVEWSLKLKGKKKDDETFALERVDFKVERTPEAEMRDNGIYAKAKNIFLRIKTHESFENIADTVIIIDQTDRNQVTLAFTLSSMVRNSAYVPIIGFDANFDTFFTLYDLPDGSGSIATKEIKEKFVKQHNLSIVDIIKRLRIRRIYTTMPLGIFKNYPGDVEIIKFEDLTKDYKKLNNEFPKGYLLVKDFNLIPAALCKARKDSMLLFFEKVWFKEVETKNIKIIEDDKRKTNDETVIVTIENSEDVFASLKLLVAANYACSVNAKFMVTKENSDELKLAIEKVISNINEAIKKFKDSENTGLTEDEISGISESERKIVESEAHKYEEIACKVLNLNSAYIK